MEVSSFVTGVFQETAVFGPGERNETTLTGSGIFVAKYSRDGALQWVTHADGNSADDYLGIGITSNDLSYIAGEFAGEVTFGPEERNETTLTAAGRSDILVAKVR